VRSDVDAVVDDVDEARGVALLYERPPRALGHCDHARCEVDRRVVERGVHRAREWARAEVILDVQVRHDDRAAEATADPRQDVRGERGMRVQDVDIQAAEQAHQAREAVYAKRA
jgi:hypothetical protein